MPNNEEIKKEGGSAPRPDSVIVEIRAGTGGEEAALFAGDLFRMYSKYASFQGWKQRVLDSHPTELGGFKEIVFEIKNGDVFSKTKYEGGVHRVQRIPKTEKSGRVHTSTATVAVLPKPKATEIKIKPEEIRVDYYRASGPGGQYVNRRETAVRITHLPTGLAVTSQTERNQLQNKENAMSILAARLLEKKQQEEESKIAGKRKTQIGWAKRAEKIKTYNFPQDRLTDHRIKKTWHGLEEIMGGKLDKVISTLQKKLE
jgi:peptide chain release factor 1